MKAKKVQKGGGNKTALGIIGALAVGAAVGSVATYALYSKTKNYKKLLKKNGKKSEKAK